MLNKLINIKNKKVLVIGDAMLDHYVIINPRKISSEYPGIIFDYSNDYYRLGGASNVANNISKFNVEVDLLCVIGKDNFTDIFYNELNNVGINTYLVIEDSSYKTIVKERYCSSDYKQIMRVDYEKTNIDSYDKLYNYLERAFENKYDLVIISDYRKGVITNEFYEKIISLAKENNIRVICDPKDGVVDYKDLFILKPNKKETSLLFGDKSDSEIISYMNSNNIDNIIITLGDEGLKLLNKDGSYLVPVVKNEVYDVTGAGDTILSFLALGYLAGIDIKNSCVLANKAGSIKVGKFGTYAINLLDMFTVDNNKILNRDILYDFCSLLKEYGKKVVFTNGCFDIVHSGHIHVLKEAKKQGDVLILGLNSDSSIKRLKGKSRPIFKEEERLELLSSFEFIDYIVVFDEDTPLEVIKLIRPDVLVKGADYKDKYVVGTNEIKEYGGELVLVDLIEGRSTTNVIEKLKG